MARAALEELLSRPWLLADGATGTNLFARGLMSGDAPELWNETDPDKIEGLHLGFVEAGADIILTNSFGGNRYRLKLHQAEARVRDINRRAAEIARRAAESVDRPVIVAGSMGPTGELFVPLGSLMPDDGAAAFAEQALALKEGGADVLWIETMSSQEEVIAAVKGAAEAGLPIVTTMSFDTNGRTMMGITPQAFGELARALTVQPVAIGANCGTGASELVATVAGISEARPDAVVVAKGNCGIPEYHDGHIHYSGTPELMAEYARMALDAGARIIGGCCGTTPHHLGAMRQALETHQRRPCPSVEEIEARLGPVSALAHGYSPDGGAPRQRRRRRA